MKVVAAAEFKNSCLALLDEVQRTRQRVIVTRHGKPVAQIQPIDPAPRAPGNPLKGSIVREGDLVSPIDGGWDAGA
jgi:prevent-host-death family protein